MKLQNKYENSSQDQYIIESVKSQLSTGFIQ